MAIPFYDEVNTIKRVNIVNSDDSKLKDIGFKPLIWISRLIYDKYKNDFIIKKISDLSKEIDREMEEEIK